MRVTGMRETKLGRIGGGMLSIIVHHIPKYQERCFGVCILKCTRSSNLPMCRRWGLQTFRDERICVTLFENFGESISVLRRSAPRDMALMGRT